MAETTDDPFALLFSPKVESIRLANLHVGLCRCLHVTFYENNPVLNTVILQTPKRISDLLNTWIRTQFNTAVGSVLQDVGWTAYLSFDHFVIFSECSHGCLHAAIQLGGRPLHVPCVEFLSRHTKELWQRSKAEIMRAERWRYGASTVYTDSARRIQSAQFSEVFWAKLRFQIQRHLHAFHCCQTPGDSQSVYGRRLTVEQLLCDIGIFDGHRHLNFSAIPLLTSVLIPERRYWRHWWKYWKFWYEPSERNVVLGILSFSLYVTRVCDTCNQELEAQRYHIHPELGVQRWRRTKSGIHMWVPGPLPPRDVLMTTEMGRHFQATMDRLTTELGTFRR